MVLIIENITVNKKCHVNTHQWHYAIHIFEAYIQMDFVLYIFRYPFKDM